MERTTDIILFNHDVHKGFYFRMLGKCDRKKDVYYRALFYTLGICKETRNHIKEIFDFEDGNIMPEAIYAPWQTKTSLRLTRLAFNLWNGWTESGRERFSAPYELFDCGLAPYFWEAIKLRYPEYCRPR